MTDLDQQLDWTESFLPLCGPFIHLKLNLCYL